MKLCRFDLISSPGTVRSGVVYAGKIYETDGLNPIAMHEASDARLLAPVGLAPSVRLFDTASSEGDWAMLSEGQQAKREFSFAYLNASIIVGPQTELLPFPVGEQISFKPCLAAVVSARGTQIPSEEAEPYILGITLANVFYAADIDRIERVRGQPPSRSHDLGIALGPVVTTPDELEEALIQDLNGRRYRLAVSAHVNDREVFRVDTEGLPFTFAELLGYASESAPVQSGDILCVALGEPEIGHPLESGDDVRLVNDRLGTLVSRIG